MLELSGRKKANYLPSLLRPWLHLVSWLRSPSQHLQIPTILSQSAKRHLLVISGSWSNGAVHSQERHRERALAGPDADTGHLHENSWVPVSQCLLEGSVWVLRVHTFYGSLSLLEGGPAQVPVRWGPSCLDQSISANVLLLTVCPSAKFICWSPEVELLRSI